MSTPLFPSQHNSLPRLFARFLAETYPQGVGKAALCNYVRTGVIPELLSVAGEPFPVRDDYYKFLADNPA